MAEVTSCAGTAWSVCAGLGVKLALFCKLSDAVLARVVRDRAVVQVGGHNVHKVLVQGRACSSSSSSSGAGWVSDWAAIIVWLALYLGHCLQ